jgi:hypothetical protein
LRDQAQLEDTTVSELMRAALSDYLSRAQKQRARADADDEVPPEARDAIAESARVRRLARMRQRAPVLPGMTISSSAALWEPPPGLPPPKQKGWYAKREYPMSVDYDGNPVEPPANAVGWRVLIKRYPGGPRSEFRKHGLPLILDLRIKHHEFAYAVGYQSAAFYLQPIDEHGRVLRFTEVYVPLGSAGTWDDD